MISNSTSNYAETINKIAVFSAAVARQTAETQFVLSKLQLADLLNNMPPDFKMSNTADFKFALGLGMTGPEKEDRLNIILHSPPMLWLKEHHPVECSNTICSLIKRIPQRFVPDAAQYILSGEFASKLASKHPQAYATLFFDLVKVMDDQASEAFARVKPVDENSGLYSVLPAKRLGLPPLALIYQKSGCHRIEPIQRSLMNILSHETKTALHAAFTKEVEAAARKGDYGTSARLLPALDVLANSLKNSMA